MSGNQPLVSGLLQSPGFVDLSGQGGGAGVLVVAGLALAVLCAALVYGVIRLRATSVREAEDARRRLDSIFSNVVDGMITIDEHGTVESYNRACERLFGYEAGEVIGKNVKMLMPEPYHSLHDHYLDHYLSTGEKKIIGIGREVTAQHKSGRIFPIDLSISEIQLQDKRIFSGIIRDITEQKRSEKLLKESEQRLSLALEGSSMGLWDWHIPTDRLDFSDRWAGMLGYHVAELTNKFATWEQLTHAEDVENAKQRLAEYLAGKRPGFEAEFRMRHKNGGWRWVESRGKIFEWDAHGAPLRVVGTHVDRTKRRKSEEEIADSRAFLELMMNKNPDLVFVKDEQFRIVQANQAFLNIYPPAQRHRIIGYTTLEALPETDWEQHLQSDKKALRDGYSDGKETLTFANGQTRIIYMQKIRFENPRGERFILGLGRDITEQEKMETMKDEFISTVNHELRTPLTSIQASLGLLQATVSDALSDKGQTLLAMALENCERLALLVNDILDMEKIAAGRMDYQVQPVEMNSAIRQIIGQNQSYAEKYRVHFDLQLAIAEVYCHIDYNRFTQALVNLLSNAAKFSPEGETVTISLSRESAEHIRITVADRGPGIPKDFQSKIFQKFSQADSSSTRGKEGTGLGLNITKSIIDAFYGAISFYTEEGKGTRFFIILPTVVSPNIHNEGEPDDHQTQTNLICRGRADDCPDYDHDAGNPGRV